jgi:uncharacterized protein YegL
MPIPNGESGVNNEPRCACILLLDISGSMQDEPISALAQGIKAFSDALKGDFSTARRVEIAIITFGESVQLVQDFVIAADFVPPQFVPAGNTPMGEAVVEAFKLLDKREAEYSAGGIPYFRPWVILFTDGEPSDYRSEFWKSAVKLTHEAEASKRCMFYGIAVNLADQRKLIELCQTERHTRSMMGLNFTVLFSWLFSCLQSVSRQKLPTEKLPISKTVC